MNIINNFCKIFLFVLLIIGACALIQAQPTGANCFNANPFCSGQNLNFPNNSVNNNLGANAPFGPNYGCLFTQPRPIWYYMQIAQTGPISLALSQTTGPNGTGFGLDVDFAMWGPFNDLQTGCNAVMSGAAAPLQCSYSGFSVETIGIGAQGGFAGGASFPPIAVAGQVYIVLLTNFSNQNGFISLEQTNQTQVGAGATDCGILSAIQNNGPLCIGQTLNLTANNVTNATSWTWTGPNGFTSNQQFPGPIANVNSSHAGVYTMTVTTASSTATFTTTVVINNPPVATITKTDATCNLNNGSATIATTGAAPFSYVWTPASGNNATIQGLAPGNYSVEVTDNNGCKDTVSTTIDLIPNFSLSIIDITDDICGLSEGSAQIEATGGSGNYTYSWTGNNSTQNIATELSAGIYTCTVNDGICTQSINVTIDGNTPLSANIVSNIDKRCLTPGVATVDVNGGTAPYNYSWSTGGVLSPITESTNPNMQEGDNSVIITDANNCSTMVDFITKESEDTMIVKESVVNASCNTSDGSITLDVTGGLTPFIYSWSSSNEEQCECASTSNEITNIPSGYYTATITDANMCVTSFTSFVDQPIFPEASFDIDSSLIEKGEPVLWVIDKSKNSDTRYYEFNDGTQSRYDEGSLFEHAYNGNQDILLCITQIVNSGNCYDTVSNCINIIGQYTMYIPNSFTPNSNKLNDDFKAIGRSVKSFSMVIYDRWGSREVFRTDNINEGWNGTIKNSGNAFLPQGIYVYKIDVVSHRGKEHTYLGNITLLR